VSWLLRLRQHEQHECRQDKNPASVGVGRLADLVLLTPDVDSSAGFLHCILNIYIRPLPVHVQQDVS
jgi:hypothetical protein